MLLGLPLMMIPLAHGGERVDLAWALQQTLDHNPELAAFPFRLRRSDGLIQQAEVRPLLELGFSGENLAGSGDYQLAQQAELTLALSRWIELGGKRAQRVAFARAERDAEQAAYELTRLDTLAKTGRRYYQVLRLQSLATWIDAREEKEARALTVIERRARAGAVGRADVSKMALRLAGSRALREQLQGELSLARLRLAAMWLGEPGFGALSGDLAAIPALPGKARVSAALEASPRLLRQTALARLADTRVALAEANGRVDLQLGLGLRQFQETHDRALVVSLNLPLAFRNPNRGRIAAAEAERELSWQQREARHRELEIALLEVQQQLANRDAAARRLQQELLPLARTQLSETERGYQLGQYSFLEWVEAQSGLYALQRALIEARTAVHVNLLELERITGQALAGAARGATP